VVFVLGLGLTVVVYWALHRYLEPDSLVLRYLAAHWVEYVETWMFIWACLALIAKTIDLSRQRLALKQRLLPSWNGTTVPVTEASMLLDQLARLPRWLQASLVGQRVRGALEFVESRGSTDGLDDHLRSQSDNDANAVEGSYALIRFITWAIPILGFLGTVLGITEAIANVTPEQLANSITGVTGGLAIAFDTTAIALVFSMCVMFFSFVLDRGEQGVLGSVDAYAEQELAHRFERHGAEGNELLGIVGKSTQLLIQAIEQLVQRQADVWARSLTSLQSRLEQSERQQHERVISTLTQALERSLKTHQDRLVEVEQRIGADLAKGLQPLQGIGQALERTQQALVQQAERTVQQAALLQPLLDGEQQILRLQESLNQNLHGLANSGAFQEAMHSLTAAIHLLTARVDSGAARTAPASTTRLRPGNAA
jgi:biopolymer transport protein ExbB/TolQ